MTMLCGLVYMALPNLKTWMPAVTASYTVNMDVVWALTAVGGVLMLFFNDPAKNPLANLGGGLWNTYNDVTGLLGDLLSYIRLFALCLSGGTLALVFNKIALAMPIPVTIIILLFGHMLNLFMSALGAFVHPLRLTFVEFYKNAGFEAASREFKPLKK
jgi:V/A-type H+-transporting ATPase subunit I